MLAPSLMHFLVHSAAPSLAPFTPHLESAIQPLTVVASPANEAVANSETNATAANANRNFRMPSSFETFLRRDFDALGFQNSITPKPPPHSKMGNDLFLILRAPGWRFWRRIGCDIDILPGTCVVKLFACLSLDRPVIGLQRLDTIDILIVFLLQALHFALQSEPLSAFLLIHDDPVGAKHRMQQEAQREQHRRRSADPPPLRRDPRPDRARLLHVPRSHFFCLGPLFLDDRT